LGRPEARQVQSPVAIAEGLKPAWPQEPRAGRMARDGAAAGADPFWAFALPVGPHGKRRVPTRRHGCGPVEPLGRDIRQPGRDLTRQPDRVTDGRDALPPLYVRGIVRVLRPRPAPRHAARPRVVEVDDMQIAPRCGPGPA